MTVSRLVAGSLLALSATGCLATKGDIRLLQEELRATRASVARSDSAQRRTSDSLAAALASLASSQARSNQLAQQAQQRTADSLRALSARVTSNDITTREQLKAVGVDVDQLRENVRQNARSGAFARAQMEQARPPAPTLPTDSGGVATPPASSGPPGPATLLVQGRSLMIQGSCATARRTFQDLLAQFPDSPEAAEAQYNVAESFVSCTDPNPAKADSVYRIVTERWPRSDFAATALYKRAEALRIGGKVPEARPLYEQIVCQHPRSTVYAQALNRIGGNRPAACR
jgi:TolA-binding protein